MSDTSQVLSLGSLSRRALFTVQRSINLEFHRQFLPWLLAAGGFWLACAQPVCAEDIWIRPGAYIDWPESLKGDPAALPAARPEGSIARASYNELSDVPAIDPLLLTHPAARDPLPSEFLESQPLDAVPIAQETWLPAPAASRSVPSGWELLPEGLLYHSYLAGEKEPRMAAQWLWDKRRGLVWEAAVGGRWGLVRGGTPGPRGDGFQFDIEGGALVRIDPEEESDLEAADFRAGFVGTWRRGPWRHKVGYAHVSSHLGDEFVIKNPGVIRHNYVRDSILAGVMYDITPDLQVYGELAAALNHNGGAEPLEAQVGLQYSPADVFGPRGAPFAAINGHFRQEFGLGGSVNIEAGWQWRGAQSDRLFRVGVQHYNGPSMQWSFVDRYECLTGIGMWFDY